MPDERIVSTSLKEEIQRSYLEYAMSVIVGRALPDVRDGLKPVQRRILFAMHELGLTPDRPFRKCARVVGDVLGKYHPHSDQSVYEALVRQVQEFSSRHPLLEGHGNFGSVDDDPPAAMRYTETRLAAIAHQSMLGEIGEETVDFVPNFDGSQQEPNVLPAQLPFLLLNGCTGIAVGMATSIPPHNLGEVVEGLVAMLKNPEISDAELLNLIPGPDFPTGGEVIVGRGLQDAYLKGRGSIPMRGIAHVEEIQPGKGKRRRNAVVVTAFPYQLSKAGWIEKLAELVNDGRLQGIADIRDESDREGLRVVIELRRDGQPQVVLQEIMRRTMLQSNFGAILLALVDGRPTQLSLREMLQRFLEFRELTAMRRCRFALRKIEQRLEVVNGLLLALAQLDHVIGLIRSASDAASAQSALRVQLEVNDRQAEAVLAMPLRRLTTLEQDGLRRECGELEAQQQDLQDLLANRDALVKQMIHNLRQLQKRFKTPRRTQLVPASEDNATSDEGRSELSPRVDRRRQMQASPTMANHTPLTVAPPADAHLLLQSDGTLRLLSPTALDRLQLDQPLAPGSHPLPPRLVVKASERPNLVLLSQCGRVGLLPWDRVGLDPVPLADLLPVGMDPAVGRPVQLLRWDKLDEVAGVAIISSEGRSKWLSTATLHDLSARINRSGHTVLAMKPRPEETLRLAVPMRDTGSLVIALSTGRLLRVAMSDDLLPGSGRASATSLLRLLPGEAIVGATCAMPGDILILLTRSGQIKRLCVDHLRLGCRGSLGQVGIRFLSRDDVLLAFGQQVGPLVSVLFKDGRSCRIPCQDLPLQDCSSPGVRPLLEDSEPVEMFAAQTSNSTHGTTAVPLGPLCW